MKRILLTISLLISLSAQAIPVLAQSQESRESVHTRIRKEGKDNSQIMKTLQILTDLYGPRLTGSPAMKSAGEWTAKQMLEWGFDSAGLVPWEFGHPGWSNERASGFMISPVKDSLVFEVLAWTPSTRRNGVDGVVTGDVVSLVLPDRPTRDELEGYFADVKSKVTGKMVLIGKPAVVPVNFNPPSKRLDDYWNEVNEKFGVKEDGYDEECDLEEVEKEE